ncbi:Uncharacterised protein [Mycobacteroides abscessus subsp. abscessus]|nr:Uncharacterised protein [Mycobacteroides abscessus subsp. abscessus]
MVLQFVLALADVGHAQDDHLGVPGGQFGAPQDGSGIGEPWPEPGARLSERGRQVHFRGVYRTCHALGDHPVDGSELAQTT